MMSEKTKSRRNLPAATRKKDGIFVEIVCLVLVILFSVICIVPFFYLISGSITAESHVLRGDIQPYPTHISFDAYEVLFSGSQIFTSYGVSIFVTLFGTLLSLVFTSFFAYPLSTGRLRFGNIIGFYVYFTMIFSGGLVPTYIWYTQGLHLTNTFSVLILPSLLIPWNMFLLRNFFSAIPASLAESARIDGCGEPGILFRIILPCSKPALATVGLFYAIGYWNEWYKVMLYNSGDKAKWTLQFLIMKMMNEIATIKNMAGQGVSISMNTLPTTTMRLATAICTIGPIIIAYPFAQKYFTSGIMLGAVKG